MMRLLESLPQWMPALLPMGVQGAALLLFLGLSWLWPRANQPPVSRDTAVNIATGGGLFLCRYAVLALAPQLPAPHLIPLSAVNGFWAQLLLVFILGDMARYWLHRAHHEVGFLWTFHRAHHSSRTLDATSGLRMHVVDFAQLSLLPYLLFAVLLDTRHFSPWVWSTLGSIIALMDAFQHANLRFPLERPWARAWYRVLNTPHFHSWHHTREGDNYHSNYGQTLVIWDRLFRTALDRPTPALLLGLTPDQEISDTLIGLQGLRPPRTDDATPMPVR